MNIKNLQSELLESKFKNSNWYSLLKSYLLSEDFTNVLQELYDEYEEGKTFVPNIGTAFRAFELTDPETLKVVILGQDPYPMLDSKTGLPVADGIAFSCSNQKRPQPSLRLILNAINKTIYNYEINPDDFNLDLSYLSDQGVLLLNSALTTRLNKPGTHLELWSSFITYVIDMLNDKDIIWVFLGKKAQEYEDLVKSKYKLFASHPASAVYKHEKDWDCNDIFNEIDRILKEKGESPIVW